jgi:hypothetical protein
MKMKTALILFTSFAAFNIHAQSLSNFFAQKKTELQYMIDQVAAYKIYLDDLTKGYNLAKNEIQAIHDIKNGEFNLHENFFNSLKIVNPEIKNTSLIFDILDLVSGITGELNILKQSSDPYISRVRDNMLKACAVDLEIISSAITDDRYTMGDGERISRLEFILGDLQNKYEFSKSFVSNFNLFRYQQQNLRYENNFLSHLSGLQP